MAKKNEAKIKFTAETQEFSDGIKKANKDIAFMKSELRLNAAEMRNNGTSIQGLVQKQQLLEKQQQATKEKTKNLKEELKVAKRIFGEDSNEVANLTKKINDSKISELNLEKQLRETTAEIKEQKKQTALTAEQSEKLKEGLDKVSNVSGVVAGAVGAVATASTITAAEQEAALDKLQAKLGLTESQMESYKKAAKEVYQGGYGENMEHVSNTLAEIRYQLGSMSESELTNITKGALTLEDVFDMDVKESIRATSSMMKQFDITAGEAFNLMVQGAQNGLNQNEDLCDTINEYSVQFKNAGYSAEDMFNMLANGVATGTWSVDKLGDAVKEMNIRFSDGTIKKALDENKNALGLTGQEIEFLQKKYNQGGESAKEALQTTMKHLGNVKDESTRYQIGVSMFGTMWEDLGETTVRSLVDTQGAIKKTNTAMKKADSSAYDNVASDINQAKRKFEELGQDILQDTGPQIKQFAEWAKDNSEDIITGIKGIGIVAGTAFAVNKVVKFGQSLASIGSFTKTVIDGIKKMTVARAADTTATTAQTTAQTGLLAVMQANPVILFGTAVAGLAAGLVYLGTKTKELPPEAKEAKEAYKELNNMVLENGESIEREYAVYDRQLGQLDEIVDKNGKIKKGKEDQAKVITGELSEALGIEIEIVDGQIEGYKKLRQSVNKAIAAKKAEALLDANKEAYTEAITTQEEYATKMAETSDKIRKKKEELKQANDEVASISQRLAAEQSKRPADQSQALITELNDKLYQAKMTRDLRKDDLQDLKTTLNEQTNTYKKATDTITNYENLQVAAQNGNTKKIKQATTAMINNLKTATTASKEELQKQYDDADANVKKMKAAYERGEVPKAAVKQARKVRNAAKAELDKADYTPEGKKAGESYGKGISKADVSEGVKKLTDKIKEKMKFTATVGIVPKSKNLKNLQKIVFGIQSNAKGNIIKNPILTTFAENGPEAAIPINNQPRSRALWLKTGEMMGVINTGIGNQTIARDMELSQTNALLSAILKKDSNMYISGKKVSETTSSSRDSVDGINIALAKRGIAIE